MEYGSYYVLSPGACCESTSTCISKPLPNILHLSLGPDSPEVNNLTVGRIGFGEVVFLGETNVDSLDVQKYVKIGKKFVEVYPGQDEPPIGEGLNKPALVTLFNIFGKITEDEQCNNKFLKRLKLKTAQMGAKFISYDSLRGSWSFRVEHFSKYGLNDSDEECDIVPVNDGNKSTEPKTLALLNQKKALDEKTNKTMIQDVTEKEKMDTEKDNENSSLNESQSLILEASEQDLLDISMPSDLMDDVDNAENIAYAGISSIMTGLDSERIQSMKSSLFHDDNFDMPIDYVEDFNIMIPIGVKKPKPMSQPLSAQKRIQTESRMASVSDELIEHYKVLQSAMPQKNWQSENIGTTRTLTNLANVLDFKKSIMFQKQHFLVDSGLYMGKSFRVGWGSKMKLIYQGSLGERSSRINLNDFRIGSISDQPIVTSNFSVSVSQLESTNQEESTVVFANNLVKNLQVQLNNKKFIIENESPLIVSNEGVKLLHDHADLAQQEALTSGAALPTLVDAKHMWDLCIALWGNLPIGIMEEKNTYNLRYDRKTAFSKWLMNATESKLQQETLKSRYNSDGYLSHLYSLLTGHQIAEACKLAIQKGDYRLSLIIANATSTYNRAFLEKQLDNWLDVKAHEHIDKSRLKIFALLAGCLIWNLDPDISVNCCEHLDWKRVLAVHLWYYCPSTADICDAVREFEKSFLGTSMHGKYSQPPYPAYIENDPELLMAMFVEELETVFDNQSKPYDVCYHLLKLYCDRSMRLDRLLSTQSYSLSHVDYGTSWFLYQVLQTLGYNHLPLLQTHQLHDNFATQLEALDLWEWSIFVLLHISNPVYRKDAVMNYLIRYVRFSKDEEYLTKESFVIEQLGVPKQWIFFAKSILARSMNRPKEEAWCLLKSGHWSESHRIIIQHIAPDCIINEDFEYLKEFLMELSDPEISATILEWPNGGEVCLDYIRISEAVDSVLKGQVKAYDLEELQPQLVSLSKRICNLQSTNAKETLCQSEMAKKTATLLRAVLMLQKSKNNGQPSDHLLAPYLSKLPMPEDYALQELRTMTRAYRLELSSSAK